MHLCKATATGTAREHSLEKATLLKRLAAKAQTGEAILGGVHFAGTAHDEAASVSDCASPRRLTISADLFTCTWRPSTTVDCESAPLSPKQLEGSLRELRGSPPSSPGEDLQEAQKPRAFPSPLVLARCARAGKSHLRHKSLEEPQTMLAVGAQAVLIELAKRGHRSPGEAQQAGGEGRRGGRSGRRGPS